MEDPDTFVNKVWTGLQIWGHHTWAIELHTSGSGYELTLTVLGGCGAKFRYAMLKLVKSNCVPVL